MEFVGFQRELPPGIWIILWVVFIGITLWSYYKTKELNWNQKIFLGLLRVSALTLLLILLLNPIFFTRSTENRSSQFLVLLDKSESTSLLKGSYNGLNSYNEILDILYKPPVDVEFESYGFGSVLKPHSVTDSLVTRDADTRILDAIEQVASLDQQKDGVILVSDGIITDRNDPSFEVQGLNMPFYVIGLGDTSNVRDISISEVQRNSIGYYESTHSLEILIQANGFENQSTNLVVFNDSEEQINKIPITFSSSLQSLIVPVSLDLNDLGLQKYTIRVEALSGEWTTINNEISTTINVIDNTVEILHIASQIHPDVGMIRRLIATNPQLKLSTWTLNANGEILEELDVAPLISPDIIIWHGVLSTNVNNNDYIRPFLTDEIPSLYLHIPSPETSSNNPLLNSDIIPDNWLFTSIGNVQIQHQYENSNNPIVNNLTTLSGTNPSLTALLNSDIDYARPVINARYIGNGSVIPVLYAEENNTIRKAYISAWNWFLFSQSIREEERAYVDQLFTNLLFWLANDPNNDLFEITTSRNSYSIFDEVHFDASLRNEQSQPDNDASVEVLIYTNDDSNSNPINNIQLIPEGQGQYSGSLDLALEGTYRYQAIVRKNGAEIVRKDGEFVIQDSNKEFIETTQNTALLKTIATNSEGTYFDFSKMDTFWADLSEQGKLEGKTLEKESYWYPVQHIFWFILVLVFLGFEWFFRKWWNLV
ncbi:MAG: hypothetical protein EBR32_00140 [Bacteroidetes bacterium]|nr:hypothetical protein [Bacteroidota bacterium]